MEREKSLKNRKSRRGRGFEGMAYSRRGKGNEGKEGEKERGKTTLFLHSQDKLLLLPCRHTTAPNHPYHHHLHHSTASTIPAPLPSPLPARRFPGLSSRSLYTTRHLCIITTLTDALNAANPRQH